jgi:hypothetical protein
MILNVFWFSCKVPFILVRFQRNLAFLDRFSKYTQISNFMKIRPVGAELFPADGGLGLIQIYTPRVLLFGPGGH